MISISFKQILDLRELYYSPTLPLGHASTLQKLRCGTNCKSTSRLFYVSILRAADVK